MHSIYCCRTYFDLQLIELHFGMMGDAWIKINSQPILDFLLFGSTYKAAAIIWPTTLINAQFISPLTKH